MTTFKHKKHAKQNNRIHLILFCLFMLFVLLYCNIMSINAYFTATDSLTNTITIGYNEIEVKGGAQPYVENTGTVDCYVRVFARPEASDMDVPEWNTSDWSAEDTDGYRYYSDILAPRGISANLFNTAIPAETDMVIYAESIQSEAFPSEEAAWTSNQTNAN